MFLAQRLVGLLAVLIVVSFVVYSLLYLAPGSPEQSLLGTRPADPETIRTIRDQYNLNDPFLVQYAKWVVSAAQFDFGMSIRTNEPVLDAILNRASLTVQLAGLAFGLTVLLGTALGIAAAARRRTVADRAVVVTSILGLSAPAFASGVLLLYLFAVRLDWFPVYGQGEGFFDRFWHLVLPAVALAMTTTGLLLKITRTSFVEQLDQDYVTFAYARGISKRRVLFGYVLRNAATPIVTAAGLILAYMLAGSVLVEVTFALPGIGALLVDSVRATDIPVVQGLTMLIAAMVVLVNLVVDLIYPVIDPRIVYGRNRG